MGNNKNNISAEIIADSINIKGQRITSFVVEFPRIVLAEFNTHRMLSRNSSSSRAIKFETMIKNLLDKTFIPNDWLKIHKGMQGYEKDTNPETIKQKEELWIEARDKMIEVAQRLTDLDVSKQITNRLLEPFIYQRVIVTATDIENFTYLRANHSAENHIANLAYKMIEALNNSEPKRLNNYEWHIPFSDNINEETISKMLENEEVIKDLKSSFTFDIINKINDNDETKTLRDELILEIATARCARVSYYNFEGKDDYNSDMKLYRQLGQEPHASPFEHCAYALSFDNKEIVSNFNGWVQLRKCMDKDFENKKDKRVIKY